MAKKIIKLTESDLTRIVKQVLREQAAKHPSPEEIKKGKVTGCYTVNQGDQLFTIAKAFGITFDDIHDINGFNHGATIYPGQKIRVQNRVKFQGC